MSGKKGNKENEGDFFAPFLLLASPFSPFSFFSSSAFLRFHEKALTAQEGKKKV